MNWFTYILMMKIDGIAVLGVAPGGLEVAEHAAVRILRGEDAVAQSTIVIVAVAGRWLRGERGLRQVPPGIDGLACRTKNDSAHWCL